MAFLISLIIISLFFALPVSAPVWQHSLLPKVVQFPWRFLSITIFVLAVLIGRMPKKLGVILMIITIVFAVPFLRVVRTFHPEGFYTTNDDSTTVKNEYDNRWLTVNPVSRPDKEMVWLTPTKIQVNKMYFPGLETFVDGVKTPIDYQTNGLVQLTVSPGSHVVTTHFTETPVRLFADLLTVLGILIIFASWFSKTVWPGKR
ncbi:MAG: hypothetical protein M1484_00430 [Patescibacteria group bacterium]|nr:hypothetical protein [Patescibacteria group bacterium]MCL5431546.1 hypothetical protein [Patescibacteria group bacterium]